jgi:hypothetical protein
MIKYYGQFAVTVEADTEEERLAKMDKLAAKLGEIEAEMGIEGWEDTQHLLEDENPF